MAILTLINARRKSIRNFPAVFLPALLFATPAAAQLCTDYENVVSILAKNHNEVPIGRGVTATGRMLEVFASEGGTWTIVISRAGDEACIVSSGEGWQAIAPKPTGTPS